MNDFYLFLGRLWGKNNIGPFPERTENNSLSYYKKQTSEYTIKQTISERAQSVSLTFISDKLRPTCPWCFNTKASRNWLVSRYNLISFLVCRQHLTKEMKSDFQIFDIIENAIGTSKVVVAQCQLRSHFPAIFSLTFPIIPFPSHFHPQLHSTYSTWEEHQ